MLIRTHLIITLFFILLLLPFVNDKIIFIAVALLATYIPDIDTKKSKIGKYLIFRPIQWISKHRGIIHSLIFLIFLTIVLWLFFKEVSFGFFVGFGSHLIADSLTISGVSLFSPFSKKKFSGIIKTGGISETIIFIVFLIADLGLLIRKFPIF
ncbi:metal-dependent hydrolase [Candidatus Pacearchaeota archaeon]|jgi:inner membrane protein|nr:metal-dependent hydrolase [Candidatus Pacearchaeota archaeon]|tara:strand:- start:12189 stop:12647 length:459 start_codon:yes stop_codon:yes gene_type:complete